MIKRIILGCTLVAVSVPAWADVVIRNGSKYEITEVNVSPASLTDWGEDHLGKDVLGPNDTLTLKGVSPGKWDFRLVFREKGGSQNWKCVINEVELDNSGDDSTFDNATLDHCWENTEEEDE